LAGDENDEPKNSQLPSLRQDIVRRSLETNAFFEPENGQMPKMR
jgi:hypothetical protein